MIRENIEWDHLRKEFHTAEPFHHCVIDNFWQEEVAEQLYSEFPNYDSPIWNAHYSNAIENKKACNHWDKFPKTTYQAFNFLGTDWFQDKIRFVANRPDLSLDFGLHGGGWHAHANGGNLNMHLDYNIHPKLGLQRKLNIIIYLVKDWDPSYGGGLELWSHNPETNRPKEHVKTVDLKFNRAVLFDTTQNSWHGLPYPLTCPENKVRQSLAAYYLGNPPAGEVDRPKALFAPREDQKGNEKIEELIRQRSGINFTEYKQ
jgi:Rps23 Pro-64 3,4-dihydroxylase Tpa1-like proline 4-hydroxylase